MQMAELQTGWDEHTLQVLESKLSTGAALPFPTSTVTLSGSPALQLPFHLAAWPLDASPASSGLFGDVLELRWQA